MHDLEIKKLNESWMRLICDAGTLMDISDNFSFEVPNFKFMKKKYRSWDGKIRLVDANYGLIYTGLLPQLLEFCSKTKIKTKIDPNLLPSPPKISEFQSFFNSLPLTNAKGETIQFRDYQLAGLDEGLRYGRRTIVSPTASGKSLMVYGFVRWFLPRVEGKILIIVPTTSLVEQIVGDFKDYSSKDSSFDSEAECHKIHSGADKFSTKRVFVSTWQSLYKEHQNYFSQFDVIIGDECHQYKAESIKGILEKAVDTKYRFGLTGTLTSDGSKCNKLIIQGLFGHAVQLVKTKELMDRKEIANLDITIFRIQYPKEERKIVQLMDYQQEKSFVTKHKTRNREIANFVCGLKKNTLVLFEYQEHGELLLDLMKKKNAEPLRKILMIHGGNSSVDERERIRALLEVETDAIVIASYGIFSTGINVKNIHHLAMASPSKSQIRVCQSIGRGLRLHEEKTHLCMYDFVDDFSVGKKSNYLLKHGAERVKIYATEQFDYKNVSFEIKEK